MELVIEHINKSFKKNQVLYDVNLTIERVYMAYLVQTEAAKQR